MDREESEVITTLDDGIQVVAYLKILKAKLVEKD